VKSPDIAQSFERDQGCTETEWLRWLPGAVREHSIAYPTPGSALVAVGAGCLRLHWTVLPPRRIALIVMPRLQVGFGFEGVDAEARREFMRYFDLYMQRGGG
jgi:hypothetical protein